MNKRTKTLLFSACLLSLLLACNIPGVGKPEEDLFPTPDETMTELFSILSPIPQEETNEPEVTTTPTKTLTVIPSLTSTVTITLTEAATFTPSATITLTNVPIPARSAGYFVAKYLSSSPTIDGNWDDWSSTEYPAGAVVYGANQWTDDSDLEGAFRIGWDASYLYVAVKVKDDIYAQHAVGQYIYQGDSVEILLDADLYGDFYSSTLTSDDYQLGISPGNPDTAGPKEAIIWYPQAGNGSRPSVVIAAIGGNSLYRVEAKIPWSVLGVSNPVAGRHYGFALSVSDNDNTSENVQQSMVSCVGGRRLTNPTTWAELVLGY